MPPTGDPSAQPPVGPGPALADVLPSVARSLGVPWGGGAGEAPARPGFDLPPTRRAVIVLVDGLGHDLLVRRAGHAPWLRAHLAAHPAGGQRLPVDHGDRRWAPSAPAWPPGRTGCSATRCSCPAPTGCSTSCPGRTAPTRAPGSRTRRSSRRWPAAGVEVVRVGPAYFDGSGLTNAAMRGGRFVAAATLAAAGRRDPRRRAVGAAGARAPLLGRPRQDRPRARLRLLAVGRRAREHRPRARPARRAAARRLLADGHRRPRHGRLPARAAARRGRTSRCWRPACGTSPTRRARRSSTSSRAPATTCTPRGPRCWATAASCSPATRPWPPAGSGPVAAREPGPHR